MRGLFPATIRDQVAVDYFCNHARLAASTQGRRDMQLSEILYSYRPYNSMREFNDGFNAYRQGTRNPHDPNSVAAQAFDRGLEAGMRWARQGH
jgi:hypothetical protein